MNWQFLGASYPLIRPIAVSHHLCAYVCPIPLRIANGQELAVSVPSVFAINREIWKRKYGLVLKVFGKVMLGH